MVTGASWSLQWWVHPTLHLSHDLPQSLFCHCSLKDTWKRWEWLTILFTGKYEDMHSSSARSFGKSFSAWDFRVGPVKVTRWAVKDRDGCKTPSTRLLLRHSFYGSLHQPGSPPTQHHSSQAVWQMAVSLTPLETDNRESPDVRSQSKRGGQLVSFCCLPTLYRYVWQNDPSPSPSEKTLRTLSVLEPLHHFIIKQNLAFVLAIAIHIGGDQNQLSLT